MRDLVSTGAQRVRMMVGMNPTATKTHPPGEYDRCPGCNGAKIHAFYTDPCQYECQSCGAACDGPGIKVLTPDEARAKRPEMYHLCSRCTQNIMDGQRPAQAAAGKWSFGSCSVGRENGARLAAGLLVEECASFFFGHPFAPLQMMGVLRECVIDTGQTPTEFPSAKVASGPPVIIGSDARDVPMPDGIPADVADPMGFIYIPEGDT